MFHLTPQTNMPLLLTQHAYCHENIVVVAWNIVEAHTMSARTKSFFDQNHNNKVSSSRDVSNYFL